MTLPSPSGAGDGGTNHQQVVTPPLPPARELCFRCHRVTPRACLCHALPAERQVLSHTQVVVLQHPHEFQHKINRSVPLLDLCLPLELCVGRRLGDQIPSTTQDLLRLPHLPILIFPKLPEECNDSSKTVFNLAEIQEKISKWQTRHAPSQETTLSGTVITPKVVLIVLDATWKYAKEMHRANDKYYPSHMLRMSLDGDEDLPRDFQPRRFELRTTPNSDETTAWMSTAECVAWIVSRLENRPSIYDVTVQVLDAAVEQHRSFIANNKRNQGWRDVSGHTKKRQRNA